MLAVEKLRRISAALFRGATPRRHCMTSSPPSGDLKDTEGQNGGTLKAARRKTPPVDNYSSTVVPISVCQSAALLPVTSQKPIGSPSDDVITPTNELCVTSFGGVATHRLSDGDERSNTSTPRNYFAGANAYSGMVSVNGVCFSVYGTLPRSLIRRRNNQGQVQGHTEGQNRNLLDTLPDQICTLRRRPAPSPPKRTNSIKTDVQRPSENDLESTLTRRQRDTTPGERELNEKATDSRMQKIRQDNGSWYTDPGNGRSLTLDNDMIKHGKTTTEMPLMVNSASDERRENSASENGDQEFDDGTIKRRQKCAAISSSQQMPSTTIQNDRVTALDADSVSSEDVVVLDQEFDGGTVRRRHKPPAHVNGHLTDSVSADTDFR